MWKERRSHRVAEVPILVGDANAGLDWAERAQNHESLLDSIQIVSVLVSARET
jgi:hypothetical protein